MLRIHAVLVLMKVVTKAGETALLRACIQGAGDIVSALLKAGADVNILDAVCTKITISYFSL
jgi:hypothetical protein